MNISDFQSSLYHYKAVVLEVYDGDTIKVELDYGRGIKQDTWIRIIGFDTPELKGKGVTESEKAYGLKARDAMFGFATPGSTVYLVTEKDKENLDRLLATVYVNYEGEELVDVAELMLDYAENPALAVSSRGPVKWRMVYPERARD